MPFARHRLFDLGDVLFVINSRRVDAEDDQPALGILFIKPLDLGHRFRAERTIPREKLDQYHFATQLLELQRSTVDPGPLRLQLGGLLSDKRVVGLLQQK